jgi:YYY domain-containing protein
MTNAWDGIIYFLLAIIVIFAIQLRSMGTSFVSSIKSYLSKIKHSPSSAFSILWPILIIVLGLFTFSLPFNLNFKPFASGIGVLCAPEFLTDIGKFGPFLFEADHCQHSPLWQMLILYGFFYFWVISFCLFMLSKIKTKHLRSQIISADVFVGILIILSTLLILLPEFIYVKDIYPAHYRANTMFKLVYQAFIMLSLSSGYIIVRLFLNYRSTSLNRSYKNFFYWIIGLLIIIIVLFYSRFAIYSYFGDLKKYSGINGISYLKSAYPADYDAIMWINKNIKEQPVILEAQGDSYTDFGRISTNTGLPTVLGWTVHEWLWRGTYDIPAPRIPEIEKMYKSQDLKETKTLLKKYSVSFVFIGSLERQKYSEINEEKFESLGKIIYQKGNTKIFKIN